MKFDIIGALDIAQKDLAPHECTINCSKSQDGYLVQIKVFIPSSHKMKAQIYGQQFAFTEGQVRVDEWWVMNERFQKALESLKRQIEEG